MIERTGTQHAQMSPVELVAAVSAGRIRYSHPSIVRATDVARVLDGIRRDYPQRPVVLWHSPDDDVQWVIDGGVVVAAFLFVMGDAERRSDQEPVLLDVDTGELVSWSQRPDDGHVLLDVAPLLRSLDPETYAQERNLTGPHAEQVRDLVGALREAILLVQIIDLPRHELPRLFANLPARDGTSLADLVSPIDARSHTALPFWTGRPEALVNFAHWTLRMGLKDAEYWQLLLMVEGLKPSMPYDPGVTRGFGLAAFANDGRLAVRSLRVAQHLLSIDMQVPRRPLLPDFAVVGVVGRFLRLFPDLDGDAVPLLRRWVWRSMLSETSTKQYFAALRVISDDPVESALRLLAARSAPRLVAPGRELIDPESRRGRLVLIGMASLHPRDLATGLLIDVERTRPRQVLSDLPEEPANVMFHSHHLDAGQRTMVEVLEHSTDAHLLATHGVDLRSVELLRAGEHEAFLARRSVALDASIDRFWTSMTEPGAATRRPVASLFEDERVG